MFSKCFNVYLICSAIIRVAFVAAITVAAIWLKNIHILWWYILPALMSVSFEKGEDCNKK